ncbi:hypothetical protein [Pelagimonas varians]|uniref:hypothetical protein n=1 Tax=Pelagimonas varians TaxID=696760 RepID=UPI000BEF15B3|nr:hypothetical protein [Pelagimonas varians]
MEAKKIAAHTNPNAESDELSKPSTHSRKNARNSLSLRAFFEVMADRGGSHNFKPEQSVTGKTSNIDALNRSKGYATEFQLSKGVLANESPGALAGATEAKDVHEAAKLSLPDNMAHSPYASLGGAA